MSEEPIPGELLQRCGDEHPGGWGDDRDVEGGFQGMEPPSRAWTTFTAAFAPSLRLLEQLTCSCAIAGENPSETLFPRVGPTPESEGEGEGWVGSGWVGLD